MAEVAKRRRRACGTSLPYRPPKIPTLVPTINIIEDTQVVTIDGKSRGMVRRISRDMWLWSTIDSEGRTETETEAFDKIGFVLSYDETGERTITAKPEIKLVDDPLPPYRELL